MTNFWAAHQRFFRSLCMSMKIPTLVEIARKAIDGGQCVVIGLQSTGEARLNDALSAGDDLDDVASQRLNALHAFLALAFLALARASPSRVAALSTSSSHRPACRR